MMNCKMFASEGEKKESAGTGRKKKPKGMECFIDGEHDIVPRLESGRVLSAKEVLAALASIIQHGYPTLSEDAKACCEVIGTTLQRVHPDNAYTSDVLEVIGETTFTRKFLTKDIVFVRRLYMLMLLLFYSPKLAEPVLKEPEFVQAMECVVRALQPMMDSCREAVCQTLVEVPTEEELPEGVLEECMRSKIIPEKISLDISDACGNALSKQQFVDMECSLMQLYERLKTDIQAFFHLHTPQTLWNTHPQLVQRVLRHPDAEEMPEFDVNSLSDQVVQILCQKVACVNRIVCLLFMKGRIDALWVLMKDQE